MRLLSLTRYAGAAALFAVGADHLDQYTVGHYGSIPTIGTLFALNFASATLVALILVAPVERLDRRAGEALLVAVALAGIGIAAGSLAGLVVSEHTTFFGFREAGYRSAIVLAIGLDVATMLLLGAFVAGRTLGARGLRPSRPGAAASRGPAAG